MNIVYLVFGEELINHVQANFSILSMLTQKEEINSINIVTDNPKFYNFLSGVVNVIKVKLEDLQEWKGEYDFFWRVKIKAVEFIANIYKNENLLYLDSDTFLFGNIQELKGKLNGGNSFMHLNEGKLSQLKSKTEKRMWRQTFNKNFGPVKIDQDHCMWNAGVIGIPGSKSSQLIKTTLDICDAMLEQNITRRLIEQFAFSLSLNEFSNLIPAEGQIGHYWGNKGQWDDFIKNFIISSYFSNSSFDEIIESMKSIDYTKIPINMKIPSTKRRLQNLINKTFPERNKRFIKKANI